MHARDVGGCRSGGDVIVVGMSAEEDGKVGTRGEAHDADVRWVDVPFSGMGPGEAHSLLGVFEVRGVGWIVARFSIGLWNAILDEDAGEPDGVEPMAGIRAFTVGDEDAIASAGKDKDGGAGVGTVRGIDGESGDSDVGEADDAMTADKVIGWLGGVGFWVGGLSGLGCAVGPERERDWLGLSVSGGSEKRCGEKSEDGEAESGEEAFHADYSIPVPSPRARSCAGEVLRMGAKKPATK